jgi:hypothetical protein
LGINFLGINIAGVLVGEFLGGGGAELGRDRNFPQAAPSRELG